MKSKISIFLVTFLLNVPLNAQILHKKISIESNFLKRNVSISLFLPQNYAEFRDLPTLLLNDGQDFEQLKLQESLAIFNKKQEKPLAIVAVWANERRIYEYGTTHIADYKNRGNLATDYFNFVLKELIPKLNSEFNLFTKEETNFAGGFSLGGLSAFDMMWESPTLFKKVGVFSGSFWWRDKAYEDGYTDDNDRIMHNKIRAKKAVTIDNKFWLQCGTKDEESDRNNNGIIDSIEDTLDIIKELANVGIDKEKAIKYVEIEGGEHNFDTWSRVFPQFLEWLYLE